MLRITDVVKNLLLINVVVFVVSIFLPFGREMLGLHVPWSNSFQPFQLVTNMFMHGDPSHLIFNMLTLFFLGPIVEMIMGPRRFLVYYLTCGFGAIIAHIIFWYASGIDANSLVWGASGAISGLVIAIWRKAPNMKLSLIFPPITVEVKYLALFYIGMDLYLGLTQAETGIAHFAHLGGALTGFLLLLYWKKYGSNL